MIEPESVLMFYQALPTEASSLWKDFNTCSPN